MKQLFIRRWFITLLILVLAAGLTWPYSLARVANLVPDVLLLPAVLLAMALPLELRRMWLALQRPTAALLGVAVNSLLVPLLAWGLAAALPAELATGLMLTATVPCTLASAAVWTRRAGGDDTVALLVMLATNLSCFLVTPLWLAWTMGRSVQIDPGPMIFKLALLVTLPIVIAQGLRLYRPLGATGDTACDRAGGRRPSRHSIDGVRRGHASRRQVASAGRAGTGSRQLAGDAGGSLRATCGFAVARYRRRPRAGLARADWIAVGFSGSQKTLMVGLVVSSEVGSLALLPMIAYHFCQLVLDTLVADRLRNTYTETGTLPTKTLPTIT